MVENKNVMLDDTPDKFKSAVNKKINDNSSYQPKILAVEVDTVTLNGTVIDTIYRAYLEVISSIVIVVYGKNLNKLWISELNVIDIGIIIRHSYSVRSFCKSVIKEIEDGG